MNFRSIASGIMMSKPRATCSIAAVSASIFPEASRGRLRAAAFCHRAARKKGDPPPLKWSDLSRYGYRKIAELLRQAGWTINDKRVERIWQREGLKVPHKQPKRGRLWLTNGSCIRLRAEQRNHVWSYDFVEDRTHDGRKYRMLNVLDEFSHECLAIRVARKLKAIDVIDVLSDLFILRGIPAHIRSDNGPEFVAKAVQDWIAVAGPRPPTSSGAAPGRTATSRASMPAFAMSCSTARFSTLYARPRSSSRVGDATTTRSGLTPQSDTSHQHPRCSCPHSPRGRLRYADRLRRPRWRNRQP